MNHVHSTGAVAIGRNEGDRLARCLASLQQLVPRLVYVDSGSRDRSIELARSYGAEIVQLDSSQGFTAGRARNAGLRRLRELHPQLEFVQFVDGDCEVLAGWLDAAHRALADEPRLAVVCGRRRERYPEQSLYNRLCDMEWDTPIGIARSCGGDALMRIEALAEVGGFDPRVIAGEEPEMCVRLRQRGWIVRRLDHEMTLHDAAMTRFGQWVKRHQRAGHAFAQGAALHGSAPERHGVRSSLSIWFWAFVWPLSAVTLVAMLGSIGWALLLVYPLQALRIAAGRRRRFGDPWAHCLLYGVACVLCKWPQWVGQLRFWRDQLRGRRAEIIEYKTS